jgi:polar amino acid transport system substrate-binding protein
MSTDEASLQIVLANQAGVALVWGPSLWALAQKDPAIAKLRRISPSPLAPPTADIGAAVLANEPFLRSNIDQAIASLTADGTIKSILDANKFPAEPVK